MRKDFVVKNKCLLAVAAVGFLGVFSLAAFHARSKVPTRMGTGLTGHQVIQYKSMARDVQLDAKKKPIKGKKHGKSAQKKHHSKQHKSKQGKAAQDRK